MTTPRWKEELEKLERMPIIGGSAQDAHMVVGWIIGFGRFMAFPVYVLMHKNIGQRSYTITKAIMHLIIISVVSLDFGGFLIKSLGLEGQSSGMILLNVIYWGFIALIVKHWIHSIRRSRAGDPIHSRSTGEPFAFWYRLPLSDRFVVVEGIYEPAFIMVIALLLSSIGLSGSGTVLYLYLCAMAAALSACVDYSYHKAQMLDMIDDKLEAEYRTKAMEDGELPSTKDAKGVKSPFIASQPKNRQSGILKDIQNTHIERTQQRIHANINTVEIDEEIKKAS